MRKRRELDERVRAKELEEKDMVGLADGDLGDNFVARRYTYYNFLGAFLRNDMKELSLINMLILCCEYEKSTEGNEEMEIAIVRVIHGLHDVIVKVLKNHVASVRWERQSLYCWAGILYRKCRHAHGIRGCRKWKDGMIALKNTIDGDDGTCRIRRQPIPSDYVQPYKS